jgi:hypothetical protein
MNDMRTSTDQPRATDTSRRPQFSLWMIFAIIAVIGLFLVHPIAGTVAIAWAWLFSHWLRNPRPSHRRTLLQAFAWLVALACLQLLRFDLEDWASVLAVFLLAPACLILIITGLWIAFKLVIVAIENRRLTRCVAIAVLLAMPATWWSGHEVAVRVRLQRYQSRYDQIIATAIQQGPDAAKLLAASLGINVLIDDGDTDDTGLFIGFVWGISLLDNWQGPIWDARVPLLACPAVLCGLILAA